MKLDASHLPALAPYADFAFALAAPPPPSPLQSTPAVTYHVLPSTSTIRAVGRHPTPPIYFATFLLDHGAVSVSRDDLIHVLDLLLTRYAEAADLVAEVTKTMAEPLGKPDAAWCLEIHASVKEVARRRLEMARTFNRELMRLADLERTGHPPRNWKAFSRTGKRSARKRHSTPPSLSEDELSEAPSGSLSPLRRPRALPSIREDHSDTDWTGSMQCGAVHFVSEWVFRVTRLIAAEGFSGAQEERDAHALEAAKSQLAHLQHHMAHASGTRSPPPPPYAAPHSRTLSLTRFRSAPSPSPPPEKRKKAKTEPSNPSKCEKDKAGVCDYLRRLFVG